MSENFVFEIITPDGSIIKTEASEVTAPCYEGQIGILKDHIPLITFLRPGLIILEQDKKKYYVEEGTVEFKNNLLVILTTNAKDLSSIDKDFINKHLQDSEKKLEIENVDDKEKYLLNQKIDTLKEIREKIS